MIKLLSVIIFVFMILVGAYLPKFDSSFYYWDHFSIISSAVAEEESSRTREETYEEETARLSDEEIKDREKYEDIEASVKETIGGTAVSSSALAKTIKTVAALFGVDVKVDYDKKAGLSCFSLDSSGMLNVVSCSTSGEVLSSCAATAAADWKSATISCTGFKLTAEVVE